MLSSEERKRLFQLIEQEKISAQDSVFLLLGLHTGIRACDAIKLKLSNIDWIAETFSFTQSKTGNPVTLPLTTDLGNAIVKYIQYERPKVKSDYLFLRKNAPFEPLSRAGDTYRIIQRAFKKAGADAITQTDHQKIDRPGGSHTCQRLNPQKFSHHHGVHHVIKLLEQHAQQKRQHKGKQQLHRGSGCEIFHILIGHHMPLPSGKHSICTK